MTTVTEQLTATSDQLVDIVLLALQRADIDAVAEALHALTHLDPHRAAIVYSALFTGLAAMDGGTRG